MVLAKKLLCKGQRNWPYVVAPVVIVSLLCVCYLDSVMAPTGLVGGILPFGLGIVPRTAEAGSLPLEPPPLPPVIVDQLQLESAVTEDGSLVQKLDDGQKAVYSIHPGLQKKARSILDEAELLSGSLVLVDSRTGEILAMADTGTPLTDDGLDRPEDVMLPASLAAEAPAASVFKVVTSSALIEMAEISPDQEVCFWGGSQKLKLANLEDDPALDNECATLSFALGMSLNSVFAKLADRHLDPEKLASEASAFGFGEPLPLDYPQSAEISTMDIPVDRLEFARTAAGFWHVHMTPLHAAFIAQSIAQDGAMLRPILVSRVQDAAGQTVWESSPHWLRKTVSKQTASVVAKMMINTTTKGTARKYFKDGKGKAYLPGIKVAGKTGTLTRQEPYRAYTWFVGFAPADDPVVAVAALAVNTPKWKVKATAMARDLLVHYFKKLEQLEEKSTSDDAGAQPDA